MALDSKSVDLEFIPFDEDVIVGEPKYCNFQVCSVGFNWTFQSTDVPPYTVVEIPPELLETYIRKGLQIVY